MKLTTLTVALLAAILIAHEAFSTILVKDSFDASGYNTVGTGLKGLNPGNTTGFTSKTWGTSSSTGVFFVNDGLSLPADFTGTAAGNAIGVGKFTDDPSSTPRGRRITRTIDDNVMPASGIYYVRFACEIGADAETFLGAGDFEALGLVPEALVNTTGTGVPPNVGIHIGFRKTAAAGSAGTDLVIWTGGEVRLTLVQNVVAGKTYLVVAKVELDGTSTAAISVIAGASDDASLRTAVFPAATSCALGTSSALRHLCISGVYMTGYDNGKYATFDEFAVGTALDDVWGFTVAGAPIIVATDATAIGETGFTANGTLMDLGSSNPDLFLDVSADDGATWTADPMGTYTATGDVSRGATGLLAGATYLWRFRAEGSTASATSTVQTVTLAGAPVFGAPSATLDANAATLSVSLTAPGLSGVAPTTIELWFASVGDALALVKTFDSVTAAADFSETISDLVWGTSYNYAFRATVPYNDGMLETWTATNAVNVVGDIVWTAGAGTTDWNTAGNWNLGIVPMSALTARFTNVGGLVTASANASVSNIYVNTTGEGTAFDFGGNTLAANWFGVGYYVSESRAVISNGVFDIGTLRVGGSRANTLIVGDGADLRAQSAIYVGTDGDPDYATNKLVFASGSKTVSSGTLFLRSSRGTQVYVEPDASLTVTRMEFTGCSDQMVVDGGSFTNNSATILLTSNNRGELAETMFLELKNGANAKMKGNVYVNAGKNHGGEHYHAELRVLDGSAFDMTGKDLLVDSNSGDSGPNSDQGGGAAIVVSNATLLAQAISIGIDDRHYGDSLRIYEDPGFETRVSASANCRVGSGSWGRSGVFNHDHRILVEGGEFSVAGKLMVGDGGQYYADHDNNRIEVRRANARVTAGSLEVYGKSYLDFKVPQGGFTQVPFQVTGTADFGIVPTGAEAAVSEIRVDATEFIGRQTILEAGSVSGLSEDRVVVTARRSTKVRVFVTETSVAVSVSQLGLSVILR